MSASIAARCSTPTATAGPTAWWNGRIVGGWGQDADGRVEVRLLEDVGRDGKRALKRRADELTEWLDGVRVSPRFPSPLSKAVDSEAMQLNPRKAPAKLSTRAKLGADLPALRPFRFGRGTSSVSARKCPV